jgi:mRNA-degrading endonuclease toxin of MazEF toxin-antitoxin module
MLNKFSILSAIIVLSFVNLLSSCTSEIISTQQSSPTVSLSPTAGSNVSNPMVPVSPSVANNTVSVPIIPPATPTPVPAAGSSVTIDPTSLTQPNSNQLTIQNTLLATTAAGTGYLEPNETGIFKRGQTVNLVLLKIGKFRKGEDGKNSFDLDIELTNSYGEVLEYRQGLLGKAGHVFLPNNTAKSHVGFIPAKVTQNLEPGTYTITMTVYDKISAQSVVARKSFTLE